MKPFIALKASAGSGKTFALTVRYISLLLLDAHPKEILTLTFTNKAAAQMAERIYDTLLSLGDDEAILDAVIIETQLSKENVLAKKDKIIKKFISSELSIYTIDKFINKILREFSGYIGINDDFDIKFDDEELLLYKFLTSLDESQFDSLIQFAHRENKKLNSIVELFKVLIDKNEKLEVQHYPKGSFEAVSIAIMEDANIIKNFIDKSTVSKSGYNAVDFNTIEQLLDKGKTWLTKESLSDFSYFKKAKPPIELDDNLERLQTNVTLYYQIQESYTLENLFQIFDDFKEFRSSYNAKRNSLEFSDITNIVYKLLENHIEKDFLYFRLDAKYNHILIDEFQDTSTLQFKILFHLIDEIISGNPEVYKTFFYVGDIKQSIYRFRGGTKELFDYVASIFHPMLEVELLDKNYRSSQNVVNFVNNTFEPLSNYEYDNQKVNSKIEGYVEVANISSEKELIYEDVYNKVEELLKNNIEVNNIAILTYTNADVLAIYEYFKQKNPQLEVVTEMTSKLISQTNVKALINAIKYIYFKEDIYRVNFNALVGKEYFTQFEYFVDIDNIDVVTLLKKVAYHFDIVDDNVIRFIELSVSYDTIVDFVYDSSKDDTSIVSQAQNGISILTVFKSKGLEFDTVIVLDRVTKKNPDRSSLLFEYDDIDLKKIFYKRSKRENLDRFYEEAVNKEKKLVVADELNILYVALTRAKNNMIVLKKEKNSVFDLLGDFPLKTIGSLHKEIVHKKVRNSEQDVEYKPLNLGYQEKSKSTQDNSIGSLKARYFGIATHYCLEMMKNFDTKSLEKAFVNTQNKYGNFLDENEFEDLYNRIALLVSDTKFQEIVDKSSFTKEQALMFNDEHKIIDLLVQNKNGYVVVDYKTTTQKNSSHLTQVKKYVQAIKEITDEKNVQGYLVYLHPQNVELLAV
ncbi:RecB-like helicase [Arcobacter sp. 15-2]|uniref:RecB-like helicase n=1 Tax=Arcobacter sp. 15-2 TaxID=3374109 RepID=UPI00399D25D5